LKGDKAKGINIPNLGSDYYQAKNFIGWIIK